MFEILIDEATIGKRKLDEMIHSGAIPKEFTVNRRPDPDAKSFVTVNYSVTLDNKLYIKLKHRTLSYPINVLDLESVAAILEKRNISTKYVRYPSLVYRDKKLFIKLMVIDKEIALPADGVEEELKKIETIKKQLSSAGKIQYVTEYLNGDFLPELLTNSDTEKVNFILAKTVEFPSDITDDPIIIKHAITRNGRLSFERCQKHHIECHIKLEKSTYSDHIFIKLQVNVSDIQKDMLNLVAQLRYILSPEGTRAGARGYLDSVLETDKRSLSDIISKNKSEFENLFLIMSDDLRSFSESLISEPIFSYLSGISSQSIKSLSDNVSEAQSENKPNMTNNNTSVSQPSKAGMYRVQDNSAIKSDQNSISKIIVRTKRGIV